MWNGANSSDGMIVETRNEREKAVGYSTVGGDLLGGLGVIANVPKTVVIYLLEYLQEKTGLQGIKKVVAQPSGPELAPNQVGERELMPFPVLDACFHLFADEKLLPSEVLQVVQTMFPEMPIEPLRADVEKFVRLFLQPTSKCVQAPLPLHIASLDL